MFLVVRRVIAGVALQVRVDEAAPGRRHVVPGDEVVFRFGVGLLDALDIGMRRHQGVVHCLQGEFFQRRYNARRR